MELNDLAGLPPERVGVLMVDFQNQFCHPRACGTGPVINRHNAAAARRADAFAQAAAHRGMQVIYTRQVLASERLTDRQRPWGEQLGLCRAGSWEAELFVDPIPGSVVVTKPRFDVWQSPEFLDYLAADPVDGFIIAGVELRCCVLFAALGAEERGYRFVIPQDLVSGLDTGDGSYNDAARCLLRELYHAPETANSILAGLPSAAPPSRARELRDGLTHVTRRPDPSGPSAWPGLCASVDPATGRARQSCRHAEDRLRPEPTTLRPSMPRRLLRAARQEGRENWLATLPATLRALERQWSLLIGEPFQPGGQTAWVAPARTAGGQDLVLKVTWRHPEAAHEAAGLRLWDGQGTVKLDRALDVDTCTTALLLERCRPGTTLNRLPEPGQDLVIAGLLRRLWRPVPPAGCFRPLQVMCDQWASEFEQKTASGTSSVDPGLARDGIAAFRALPGSAPRQVLLCTDLHAGNVLAAEREPWLVIDPKPYIGDPAYDVLQHMLNCSRRLRTDPDGLIRRMSDLVGLDPGRLRLWLFARCVQESPDRPMLGAIASRIAP